MTSKHEGTPTHGLAALLDLEVLDRDLFRGENEEGAGARMSLYGGQSQRKHCGPQERRFRRSVCRTRSTVTS